MLARVGARCQQRSRKGVTAGSLIFLGFRSPLQFARPKGLFVLSAEVSAEGRATSRGSTPPLWFSERCLLSWGHRGPLKFVLVADSQSMRKF